MSFENLHKTASASGNEEIQKTIRTEIEKIADSQITHGSPSICMGKVFLVVKITSLHCAAEINGKRQWEIVARGENSITQATS